VEQDGRPVDKLQPEDSQASRISRELLFADDNREVALKQA
jgi:hypothetical protein